MVRIFTPRAMSSSVIGSLALNCAAGTGPPGWKLIDSRRVRADRSLSLARTASTPRNRSASCVGWAGFSSAYCDSSALAAAWLSASARCRWAISAC